MRIYKINAKFVIIPLSVVIIIIFFIYLTGYHPVNIFQPIINVTSIKNSTGLMQAVQKGVENHSKFYLEYSAEAKLAVPIPVVYTASMDIYRNGSIIRMSFVTENLAELIGQSSVNETFNSTSLYNGSGFVLCTSGNTKCVYKKAAQDDNFSTEIASAISGMLNKNFLFSPYLKIMSENYTINNTNDFVFSYKYTQDYNGEKCGYMDMNSTASFTKNSGGLSLNGDICVSESLGLPVYGNIKVTYSGFVISISFSSLLKK